MLITHSHLRFKMGIQTLSDSLGASGGAVEWTCCHGNKYKFSLLTLGKQSEFERAIERKALDKIRSMKDLLDKEEYSKAISDVLADVSRGDFCFGKERCSEELRSFWGISTLLGILSGVTGEEASRLMQENEDVGQLVEAIVERSFPAATGKAKAGKDQKNPTGPS